MKEDEIIRKIKELFDAEPEDFFPDYDQLEFIDKRDEIEEKLSYCFDAYVDNYDLIQEYGLELKLIQKLEWFIVIYLESDYEKFTNSKFFKKFKDHEVVRRAYSEYERVKGVKNENQNTSYSTTRGLGKEY